MHIGDEGIGFATGFPLACGLELLAKGELTQRGVEAPEGGSIDPRRFLESLSTKGAQP
jgi:saccharopine dehydrogenase-like NADP-dependent oxidoreductase